MYDHHGPIPQLTAIEQRWAELSHTERNARFNRAGLEYESSIHAWFWKLPPAIQATVSLS